jgi:isopentenyl-diphosphate delta-isomerase
VNAPILISAIAGDGTLFPMEKLRVHKEAQFHLAISVFVFDRGDLLIQKRARSKYHCGGLWANTCCSHPNWTETLAHCADVGNGLHEHERVTFFTAQARRETLVIAPNPAEVEDTRWISPAELAREIAADPDAFTPWFRIYAERFPTFEIPAN